MLLLSADFFQLTFKKKIFQEHYQSVKPFGSRSRPTEYVGPDLGPSCLQRLSADDKSPLASKELLSFFLVIKDFWGQP